MNEESTIKEESVNERENFDFGILNESLSKTCLDSYKRLAPLLNDKRINDPEILKEVENFLGTYIDLSDPSQPTVRAESIASLANFLVDNISIIKLENHEVAAKLALDASNKNTYFYLPEKKYDEANFGSMQSKNSNEFMIKLAQRLNLTNALNKVITILHEDMPWAKKAKDIVVVDDAAYRGQQLETWLGSLAEEIPWGSKIKIFLAGATNDATRRIQNSRPWFKNITMEINRVQKIPSLYEITLDFPEFKSFFSVKAINAGYESFSEDPSKGQKPIKRAILDYLETLTLTRTEFKVPDFMSFPEEVAVAFRKSKVIGYPEIEVVNHSQ